VSGVSERLTAALADRYRIERELGQGGMATVYLGHDLRHDRDVAIKVLHPDLGAALGGERFLSEIRTTARLQHPHILPLLDSGAADTFLYYVMPYVSGETLRSRLERERQLPIEDALRIAREVADALGAAHALGIIHRDIKPENILLQGGHALVADFGIALAVQHAAGQRMTQTGLSLGTPQYMSPEQAMGEKTLDARSDIYALGAVTYEMLVGEPPFTGPTVQTIVAKVLTERPTSPRAVRDTVPAEVERAILKALAKLPADRFATAEKFAEALAEDGRSVGGYVGSASTGYRTAVPTYRRTALIGVLLLATAALAAWLGGRSARPEAAWSAFTQLTDAAGVETSPSLSPDGESFAYASNARGSSDIYVQRVGGRNPVLVAGDSTVDEVWPAYSPDGRQIAYNHKGGGIFVAGATGESARRITGFGSYPAWSPDGKHLVFSSEEVETPYNTLGTGRLWTIALSGGEARQISVDSSGGRDFGIYQPAWSPGGGRIAYWSNVMGQRDLETVSVSGGDRVKVTNDLALDWAPVWSTDGRFLYFASDRGGAMGLWRVAIDEASGRSQGDPEPVATGVDVDMDLPHLSRDGNTLIFRSKIESVNPASVSFDPAAGRLGSATLLQHRSGVLAPTDISPDGKWLALVNVPDRRQDLFLMRPDGTGLTRLTDDEARDWSPRFTSDGTALVYFSNVTGQYDAWSIRLDGSARTRLSDVGNGVAFAMLSPDGTQLAVGQIPTGGLIGAAPWPLTEKTGKALTLEVEGGAMLPTFWSRDGRWLSGYVVSTSGEPTGFGLHDLTAGTTRQLNTDSRTYDLAWLPGGRVVYFTTKGRLVMQDVVTLQRRETSGSLPYPPDILGSIVASPDGRTLYYGARQIEANIWLVKRSSPATTP
jgi:eukaryotic-like serine/threonine-protein kinase